MKSWYERRGFKMNKEALKNVHVKLYKTSSVISIIFNMVENALLYVDNFIIVIRWNL